MIVFTCFIGYLLMKSDARQYMHSQTKPLLYSSHGGFHNYVPSIEELPYHVLIVFNSLYCSGSLLRSRVVVSTASCFVKWNFQRIVVKVGSESVTGLGQVSEVVAIKRHEYFGHASVFDNDISLLMLKEHVLFSSHVKKILVIEPNNNPPVGATLDVSGWASSTFHPAKYANSLLWSEMTLLDPSECLKYFPKFMTRSNFCARYSTERRLSDNGGPAVYRELLVGILSYGADGFAEPFVAVFTNISYFNGWINLNTQRFMKKFCTEHRELAIEQDLGSSGTNVGW